MKCFVAGGTGVIGRRVVPLLLAEGHDVSVLSRHAGRDRLIEDMGGVPRRADLFDAASLVVATAGQDVVINLATSIPPLSRAARRSAWNDNDRIRTEGVTNLVAATVGNAIPRYVQESVTFLYADGGDDWIDEHHPRTFSGIGFAVGQAEQCVAEFGADGGDGVDGVVLRFGQFYDVDSNHTISQAKLLKRGINPFLGNPDGHLAVIGVPAAARAVVAALTIEGGLYNVVDDDPPTRRLAANSVAATLGAPRPRAIPPAFIRRVNPSSEILMRSQRVSNSALVEAAKWQPDHAGSTGLANTMKEVLG